MELILFRRRNESEVWQRAPIDCQEKQQEVGWLYRYFLI